MHILLINDSYDEFGASATVVRTLAEGYETRGHRVSILTSHRREKIPNVQRSGNVISLPISYRPALRHFVCLGSRNISTMIEEEIQKLKPDLVHAHNVHTFMTYDALRIARKYAPFVYLTMHDVMSFAFSRLNTRRFLASGGTDATLTVFDHLRSAGLQYNPWRNQVIRHIVERNVTEVIAVSDSLRRALEQHHIPHITVVHHGIDVDAWKSSVEEVRLFRAKHDLGNRKVILFGGRIGLDKGVVPLLQAVQKMRSTIPEIVLLVVGKPERFLGMVERAGVPADIQNQIVLAGWLRPEQMRIALAAADVVTTPSLCLDTFNLMNLEAMAVGTPVVSTIFGGAPEVVEDSETGFIVDPRDIDLYAQKLSFILMHTAEARAMGKAGQQRAREHFSATKQVEEHLALFRKHHH